MRLAHVIGPGEREWFRRCRRAWDFGSPNRRNLESVSSAVAGSVTGLDLAGAVRRAMTVWYFPGMWEWPRAIVLPRAIQAFDDAAKDSPAGPEAINAARAMVERYFAWAPTVDAFAPVRVAADFEAAIPDPRTPGHDMVDGDGRPVRYHDRIHALVLDRNDDYWVLEHRLAVDGWADRDELLLAERPVTAAWGWEQFYLGMEFAGTVHNELGLSGGGAGPDGVRPDGGGEPGSGRGRRHPRSRDYARSRAAGRLASGEEPASAITAEPEIETVVEEDDRGWFRRTWIRRSRAEIGSVGGRLAAEAADMLDPELRLYPTPAPAHCGRCDYRAPCLAMNEGADTEAILAGIYRLREDVGPEEGRLGGGSWSMNRGAAPPPRWRSPRKPPS